MSAPAAAPTPASRKRRRRAPAPEPRRRAGPEVLVGIAAILLSCGALVVSVFQAQILREQQGATVWPRLSVSAGQLDDTFLYQLRNDGIGPAIIREARFSARGHSYAQLSDLLYREVLGPMADTSYAAGKISTTVAPGMVLRPGDELPLFQTQHSAILGNRLAAFVADSSFHTQIVYSDVYGACWRVDNTDVRSAGRCAEAER